MSGRAKSGMLVTVLALAISVVTIAQDSRLPLTDVNMQEKILMNARDNSKREKRFFTERTLG